MKCLRHVWNWIILVSLGATAQLAAAERTFPHGINLSGKQRGEAALRAFGSRLPEVAAFYRKSPAELRELLAQDRSIWADQNGRLLHVCEWQPAAEETVTGNSISTTDTNSFSPELTFRLHSRPGAGKVIYLDFDGHDASSTSWGADAIGRPFDTDGSPNTFSSTERDRIVYIWQRVAEDFAMYDLDVTTEEPPAGGLINSGSGDTNFGIRVVIAGNSSDWYGSAGGVAYIGSFDDSTDLPCWVFPKSLGPDNEKYIAEAVSHEVGHTLGLSHDGTTTGTTYYTGQGNWAPIMGVGYYEPIAQWSKGEYANANQTQDDLAVMLSYGAVYRADDHGDAIANATVLNGVNFKTNGVITTRTDLDFFTFTTGAGQVTINVSRAPRDSNLRLEVKLYDAFGTLLQTTNVADTTAGTQPVTLTALLTAGTYHFSVDGIGADNPLSTGYSDYASLGQYLITGSLPSDSTWLPTASGTYDVLTSAHWSANVVPNGDGAVLRFNNDLSGDQTLTLAANLTVGRMLLGDAAGTSAFTWTSSGGRVVFSALTNAAALTKTSGGPDQLGVDLELKSSLRLTNNTLQPLTLSGNITGPGNLLKAGGGTLQLDGQASHSGGTVIANGTLNLGVASALTGAVTIDSTGTLDVTAVTGGFTVASNQTLAGTGVVLGSINITNGGRLVAGMEGAAGVLTLNQDLTLHEGARLEFDLNNTDLPAGGSNDALFVGGNLNLTGPVVVSLNQLTNTLASPGTYSLLFYTGTLSGSATNFTVADTGSRYTFTFDDSVPGEIRLLVSGAPTTLLWGGAPTNQWRVNTETNWLAAGNPEVFRQRDAVRVDDFGLSGANIELADVVRPDMILVSNSVTCTITGPGKISGATGLLKQGTGELNLGGTNDFTGAVVIEDGTLRLNSPNAVGSSAAGLTLTNGATLDLNGFSVGNESVTLAGTLLNNGSTQSNALRFLTLTGPSTLGGNARWDIRAQPTATLNGNNQSLLKTGPNEIRLVDLANTGLGDITVAQGTLVVQDSTTLGAASSNLNVEASATLALLNTDVNNLNKKLNLNGGTLRNDAGNNQFAGPVTLNSNTTMQVSGSLELQGVIAGEGGITKTGLGTLSLKAANTFTGAVTISTGTLRAGNASAFGRTNNGVTIANDARLDLAGSNLGAEAITVTGDGLGNAGAIVNYGASQQNALRFVTLAGNTTFGGISRWDIRANPTASLTGNNRTLTKRGPNEVWLVDLGETGLGAISVAEGTLGLQGNTTLGSTLSNITLTGGATLGFYNTTTNVLLKTMTWSGGRMLNSAGTNTFAGNTSLSGSNNVETAAATQLILSGTLSSSGSIWKTGAGKLTLTGANIRSGITVIKAGTLQIGNGGGSGSPGSGAITNDGELVYFRTNDQVFANLITGTGAVTKLGSGVLTLSAANTFAGAVNVNALNAGILRARHSTALGVGPKIINLKSSGSPNSAGTFGIEVENNITLSNDLSWTISNDGLANAPFIPAVRSRSGSNTIAGRLLIQTGGGGARLVSDASSALHLTGPITTDVSTGRDLYLDGAGAGFISGTVTNGSTANFALTLHKEGAGSWTLNNVHNYRGPTWVKAGELIVAGTLGTNFVTVSNNATLRGTGTVPGNLTVLGTLAPGTTAAPGSLTVSGTLALSGNALFRLMKNPLPGGDRVQGLTAVTYGGNLWVTNAGAALALGDAFQLFSAASYSGNFASITLPPPAPGTVWSNRLHLDGSIVLVPYSAPTLTSVVTDGTTLSFQFLSEPGANYILEQATNLIEPVLWSPVSTNVGDGNVMILSPALDASLEQGYFRLWVY